jgi:UDP-N-acetylmuramoyl-L-alanyl-D-glutamate--2,6-diaminopimelate ligase
MAAMRSANSSAISSAASSTHAHSAVPLASGPVAVPVCGDAAAAVAWLKRQVPAGAGLHSDSRALQTGDAFVAWPGHAQDGRQYVDSALAAGASACLVEAEGVQHFGFAADAAAAAKVAAVPGLKALTGEIAAEFFGRPSERLRVLAVTGTNGKTSTAWWLAQGLAAAGRRAAVVGTLGIGEPPVLHSSGLTTPDPVRLQTALAGFVDAGVAAVALEASSIGLEEARLAGTHIHTAILTNLTQDHLDYHGSMAAYWAAKRRLFAWPGLRAAVVNIDDAHGAALAEELRREGRLDVWTVSLHSPAARLRAGALHESADGLHFELHESAAAEAPTTRALAFGYYNASNLLGVAAALRAQGLTLAAVAALLPRLQPVPGRLMPVPAAAAGQPQVLVDYAHTPDALEQVLGALRTSVHARGGRLWVVFGCGGNRDAKKRPLMGEVAQRLADAVIVTSDNPRHEAPGDIIAGVLAGAGPGARAIEDRRAAIEAALAEAGANDTVLIAGKGHETTQEIAGTRHRFNDAEVAAQCLHALAQQGTAA